MSKVVFNQVEVSSLGIPIDTTPIKWDVPNENMGKQKVMCILPPENGYPQVEIDKNEFNNLGNYNSTIAKGESSYWQFILGNNHFKKTFEADESLTKFNIEGRDLCTAINTSAPGLKMRQDMQRMREVQELVVNEAFFRKNYLSAEDPFRYDPDYLFLNLSPDDNLSLLNKSRKLLELINKEHFVDTSIIFRTGFQLTDEMSFLIYFTEMREVSKINAIVNVAPDQKQTVFTFNHTPNNYLGIVSFLRSIYPRSQRLAIADPPTPDQTSDPVTLSDGTVLMMGNMENSAKFIMKLARDQKIIK